MEKDQGNTHLRETTRLGRHEGESSRASFILLRLNNAPATMLSCFPSASQSQDGAAGRPCFMLLLLDLLQKLLTPRSSLNKIKQENL